MEHLPPTPPSVSDAVGPAEEAGFWGEQLDVEPSDHSWVWEGFLGAGDITLLVSQWKSGKTTLISILLSRMKEGGQLAGLTVRPGKAVLVSEESRCQWRPRHRKLDLRHVYFLCQPFRGKPTLAQWHALLERIAALHARHALSLVVIDTLTTFLPGRNEASAGVMMEVLLPLRRLSQLGLSVLLAHHPAKGLPLPGQAARGSGALAAFTDINLEMGWYQCGDPADRRRRLLAHSRYEETRRQLVLELNAEGTDYLVHGDFVADEFLQNWERLRMVLEDAIGKRTRQQLRSDWPADFPCPSDATLARWLQRGVAGGLICQEGTGRRADPFRYWLPGQEARWRQDPVYAFKEMVEENDRQLRGRLGLP
jgi:hypothetical protein